SGWPRTRSTPVSTACSCASPTRRCTWRSVRAATACAHRTTSGCSGRRSRTAPDAPSVEQIEKLSQDARRRAPDDVLLPGVGVRHRRPALVLPRFGLDVRGISEVRKRHFEDLRDLDLAVDEPRQY